LAPWPSPFEPHDQRKDAASTGKMTAFNQAVVGIK
jgi:hypothetical protein